MLDQNTISLLTLALLVVVAWMVWRLHTAILGPDVEGMYAADGSMANKLDTTAAPLEHVIHDIRGATNAHLPNDRPLNADEQGLYDALKPSGCGCSAGPPHPATAERFDDGELAGQAIN